MRTRTRRWRAAATGGSAEGRRGTLTNVVTLDARIRLAGRWAPAALALVVTAAVPARSDAEVVNRTRADGIIESTTRRSANRSAGSSIDGGTFWARQRADGVVEFTNLRPVGTRWK